MTVPDRIAAAVDLLDVQPADHLLEIGCGNGTAAALLCERLESGCLVAIDRSEKQIERAGRRNAPHIDAGRLRLLISPLETVNLENKQFDKIFAINVNCFWLKYERPLARVRALLKPNGTLFLFYQQPTTAKMRDIAATLHLNMQTSGFRVQTETTRPHVYCLAADLYEPVNGESR